jgi:hypothetical protein
VLAAGREQRQESARRRHQRGALDGHRMRRGGSAHQLQSPSTAALSALLDSDLALDGPSPAMAARLQRVEQFRATMEAGQTALKTAIAINGGAAAALLAFLGNLAAKQVPAGPLLPVAMLAFFGGVFFAAASLGARYLTQLRAVEDRTKVAIRYNNTAIVLGLVSLFAFCGGGILAFLGLR